MPDTRILVKRHEKVAFMQDKTTETKFNRMKGFTSLSSASNPKEYSRKYVDETFDTTDVVGYSPSKDFAFDQLKGDPVHEDVVAIIEGEVLGAAAHKRILVVDMTSPGTPEGTFKAKARDFVIVGGSHGDNADAYTYSGTMKVVSKLITGTAATTDDWATCSFTPDAG